MAVAAKLVGSCYPTNETTLEDCDQALSKLSVEVIEYGWGDPLRLCVNRWLDRRHQLTCPDRIVAVPNLSRT